MQQGYTINVGYCKTSVYCNIMFTLWYKQRQTLSLFLLAINLLNAATIGPRLDNTYSTRYTVNLYPVDNTCSLFCRHFNLLDSDFSSAQYYGTLPGPAELGKFRENTTIQGHPQLHLKQLFQILPPNFQAHAQIIMYINI